jgi:hypothetical protein
MAVSETTPKINYTSQWLKATHPHGKARIIKLFLILDICLLVILIIGFYLYQPQDITNENYFTAISFVFTSVFLLFVLYSTAARTIKEVWFNENSFKIKLSQIKEMAYGWEQLKDLRFNAQKEKIEIFTNKNLFIEGFFKKDIIEDMEIIFNNFVINRKYSSGIYETWLTGINPDRYKRGLIQFSIIMIIIATVCFFLILVFPNNDLIFPLQIYGSFSLIAIIIVLFIWLIIKNYWVTNVWISDDLIKIRLFNKMEKTYKWTEIKDLTIPGNTVNFSFKDNKLFIGFFWKFIREALTREFEKNKYKNQEIKMSKDHNIEPKITKE